jgi:hypothetical protein
MAHRVRLAILALVLAAGACASLWLSWPGQLSPDSVWQLQQGRGGVFNAWHPPVMAWLLGRFDAISPGAPGFIVFDMVLGFGALFAFAALTPRPRIAAIILAGALCASPLLLTYQGDVWKDVLFADTAVAGFAALAWAARMWASPVRRWGLIGLAFALFALAALTRQNGLLTPLWAAAGLAAIARRSGASKARAARLGGGALAGCLALVVAASIALVLHSDGEPAQARQLEWLRIWDLTGADFADPYLDLAGLEHDAPDTAVFIRRAASSWTPTRVDPLLGLPGADAALDDANAAIGRAWRHMILTRTGLYARIRLADFGQLVATPRLMDCRPLFIGLDGPPEILKALHLKPHDPAKIALARRYSLAFVGTPVLSHLVYGVLAVVLLILGLRDRTRPESVVVIAMLGAALTFTASFLIIGVACDYRYLYLLDLAAMAALLHRVSVSARPPPGPETGLRARPGSLRRRRAR